MDNTIWIILLCGGVALGVACGVIIGYLVKQSRDKKTVGDAKIVAQKIVEDGEKLADALKKEKLLEAKEENHKQRTELEKETRERRTELNKWEQRLQSKDENLDRKQQSLEAKEENLKRDKANLEAKEKQVSQLVEEQKQELERISGLTQEEAKEIILETLQKDLVHESAAKIREFEATFKEESEKKARNILALSIQKSASDFVAETTVSVVELPNDEMKGRLIGREGRNIRALEAATGIDLIIDDTPEAIILSGFDPYRREIARIAIEKLVVDGRIHPARIEEMVDKATKEVENKIKELGEQAVFEAGVHGINPELVKLIGRLNYRTSYGQNIYKHSLEVSFIAGALAAEIGADVRVAKRAGLLHDIGKVPDEEPEMPHALYGAKLAEKYKEKPDICNAIGAHHEETEMTSLIAPIVQVCDAISGARPGARREIVEAYIKRLKDLENIAMSYPGVTKTYAIQAGRELRVIVGADKIDDKQTEKLSGEIATRIQNEMTYPGQVKITVIRETRSVAYAK